MHCHVAPVRLAACMRCMRLRMCLVSCVSCASCNPDHTIPFLILQSFFTFICLFSFCTDACPPFQPKPTATLTLNTSCLRPHLACPLTSPSQPPLLRLSSCSALLLSTKILHQLTLCSRPPVSPSLRSSSPFHPSPSALPSCTPVALTHHDPLYSSTFHLFFTINRCANGGLHALNESHLCTFLFALAQSPSLAS